MAVKTVASGPARTLITPIQQPTSRGVIDSADRALLVDASKGIAVPAKTKATGGSSGTLVNGGGSVSGGAA